MPVGHSPLHLLGDWTVVDDGWHNAFTDLAWWRGSFWLAYVSSPGHFASPRSRVVLLSSADGHSWQEVIRFDGAGEDLRDPKLAVLGDRLFIYVLLNQRFDPLPYRTLGAVSQDGRTWSPLNQAAPEGWLLGRPQVSRESGWFAPAHSLTQAEVGLLTSMDGLIWEPHARITRGDGADETALAFLPDGRAVTVTRLEKGGGLFGSPGAGTLLSSAKPPYRTWTPLGLSPVTRLDGPNLFVFRDRILALGRYQPHITAPFRRSGSAFSRKRTSLFELHDTSLSHLGDLPSCGDTAYPGVVVQNDLAFISYYTSPLPHDPLWLTGMLFRTSVRMAVLALDDPGSKNRKMGRS